MISQYFSTYDYPLQFLPIGIQGFVRSVAASTQASEALVAPVVLAAVAAAVQGVVDVKTPYGATMPTSLFFGVIARSGDRKSSVLKQVSTAFDEFEQGLLRESEHKTNDINSTQLQSHPFLLEEASESGVVDLFRQGAKSVFYALDEGALLLRRLDIPALCKRFDGATIRHISRKEGSIVLADRRASVCMLIQDVTFNRFMKKKGELLIESGLLPRMLMSFATKRSSIDAQYLPSREQLVNPQNHFFHDRVRSLLKEYINLLRDPRLKRMHLILSPSAENSWKCFVQAMEMMLLQTETWEDVRAFVRRAGEHVLRLAAVLQWFTSPQLYVDKWAVDAAISIVKWHLNEAKMAFGAPPLEVQAQQLSQKLYGYMLRKAQRTGQICISRNDLIRNAPTDLRNSDRLDIAIQQLSQFGCITVFLQKTRNSLL